MSRLVVTVATIDAISPHTNADTLELAHVLGWQLVVRKGQHRAGERVVYFPPDTILPDAVAERFGVAKYLSRGRIRCAKLRGEPSFGLVVPPDDPAWELGADVAAHYGATKYHPPVRTTAGDAMADDPLFAGYTDIENMRNFPDVLREGEPVVVTEKLHGTSCRVGVLEGTWMAGSKALRRARPDDEAAMEGHLYWMPYTLGPVRAMVEALASEHRQVVLYGEVFGRKVQSLAYGVERGLGFRAFDLLLDGRYADSARFDALCEQYGVPRVPVLAREPFSLERVRALSNGPTTMMTGRAHGREGVVVRPVQERHDPRVGRVILKYVGDQYLLGNASDFTDE